MTLGVSRALRQRGKWMLSALAGCASVLGFAPFYWFPVPVLTLTLLAVLVERSASGRQALAVGFAFGLGYFLTGTSWVYVSMHDFGGMSPPLAGFATLFFCTYLALFPAVAAWITWRLGGAGGMRRALVFAAAWAGTEWVRGWMFTGFPWIAAGYSQAPASPLGGLAAVLGVYGMSWAAALSAGLLAWWAPWRAKAQAQRSVRAVVRPAAAALVALWILGFALSRIEWTRAEGAPVSVSLAQGNIEQSMKWRPESVRASLDTYLRLTRAGESRLILLPETALPLFNTDVPAAYLDLLAGHARAQGGDVVLGMPEYVKGDPPRYYNSVMNFGSSPTQAYRKHHLVPFGDYFPTWPVIAWIMHAIEIPMSSFSRGDAVQPPIRAAGQKIAVNICYEDAFGEEIIRQLPDATLLANFTNDAWWGDSIASEQHLQMAQVRALETGRYMLRATNTGMTAIIDQHGRVRAAAPQFVETVLHGTAQGFAGSTPYVRWGNWPVLILTALILITAAARRPR